MFDTNLGFYITAMGKYSHNNPCEIQEASQQVNKPFADKGGTNPFLSPFRHSGHCFVTLLQEHLTDQQTKAERQKKTWNDYTSIIAAQMCLAPAQVVQEDNGDTWNTSV